MPAAMRSPAHPDGLFGQLTGWRNEQAWIAHIPVAVARPAVAQARLALKAHEAAVQARSARLNEESAAWARWMSEHPAWDPGAWDALDAEEKRLRAKAGLAPPRSVSTWRDERASDGSRRALLRKRKRSARRAVTWNTGPLRVDAVTIRLPGLGDIEVRTRKGLPEAERLRSARGVRAPRPQRPLQTRRPPLGASRRRAPHEAAKGDTARRRRRHGVRRYLDHAQRLDSHAALIRPTIRPA